ncbi:MAG: hypothetical protein JSU01_16850 [Bacteroidetes bacterium]|nr:hypothetical protein [Bacteroidota bacterium]
MAIPPVQPFSPKRGSDKRLLITIFGGIAGVILLFFVYHWFFQKHTITFRNYTLTAISIELDGKMNIIPAGGSFDYKAKNHYRLQTEANTYLLNTKAGLLGERMKWDIDTVVRSWGNFEYPLTIGPNYFLLRVVNTSPSNIYYVTVSADEFNYKYNYNINIPNDGRSYDMGYYHIYPDTKIDIWNLGKKELYWNNGSNLTFSNINNQYVSVAFK